MTRPHGRDGRVTNKTTVKTRVSFFFTSFGSLNLEMQNQVVCQKPLDLIDSAENFWIYFIHLILHPRPMPFAMLTQGVIFVFN